MSGAVGDELHLTLSDKHPFQRRGQQRSVGFADGGVFGFQGLDLPVHLAQLKLCIHRRNRHLITEKC